MDSVARFLALLTVTAAGAATSAQAAPVSDELKLLCQQGVDEACRTILLGSQLQPGRGFAGAIGLHAEELQFDPDLDVNTAVAGNGGDDGGGDTVY